MPPYALFEVFDELWVTAANEEGANYIQVLKVSNKIINKKENIELIINRVLLERREY